MQLRGRPLPQMLPHSATRYQLKHGRHLGRRPLKPTPIPTYIDISIAQDVSSRQQYGDEEPHYTLPYSPETFENRRGKHQDAALHQNQIAKNPCVVALNFAGIFLRFGARLEDSHAVLYNCRNGL